MPFGSDPFRDLEKNVAELTKAKASPMPFGSDPFRD